MAMNEKFKKDEVWGHLGKSNKSHAGDNDVNGENDFEDAEEESPQLDARCSSSKIPKCRNCQMNKGPVPLSKQHVK